MRVRTEAKRQEIVAVAAELFQELGYDRTSMAAISQRLGGSKATLYGYFKSKEELLLAVLDYDITEGADALMHAMLAAPSFRDGLILLGSGYLARRLSAGPISHVRLVSNQPEESGIGKTFYENILQRAWERLSNRFGTLMDDGVLRRADPWVAAMQWKGLVELDLFDRRLLGAISEPDADELRQAAVLAADAFLQLYGTPAALAPRSPALVPSAAGEESRPRAEARRA
ncbi:TetR/AcrR family transcriptional regulator [Sphingomonas parva]|uniref:TetR/AcrR family transcriptional regulator n=1 Tax=Sphingomonas parva TaxID=2555898 RepID=UPI001430FA6C|nr:TetR/AcrR family transcriptional regulator [Sphingomonas parva]